MAAAKKSALSRLNTPAKVGLGALMLLLPLLAFYVIFYSDIESQIAAAESQNQQLARDLAKAKLAEAEYQKDLIELRQREQTKRELMKVLPATTESPAFLSSIQNVANLVGVELRAWTPQEEVPEEFYARVPMKIELSGKFHELAKFFYNVGQLERIINMENIALSSPKEVDADLLLKAEVLATAFHAVDEVAKEAPTQAGKGRK